MALAGLISALFAITASGATTNFDLYPRGDSEPVGSMSTPTPPGGGLPNFDSDRNSDPGLSLSKTDGGSGETDPTKYQRWDYDASGLHLNVTGFTMWAAVKDFETGKTGRVAVYLMDCAASCVVLDSSTHTVPGAATWIRVKSNVKTERTFAVGHSISVKIVVLDTSDVDMWFAYATASYPAALAAKQVVATTTTTTIPTTSTLPPTTTSTVVPPPTTSTTIPWTTTTTTVPGEPASSSTTLGPGSSTADDGEGTTSTTTILEEQSDVDNEPTLVVSLDGVDPPSVPPDGVSVLATSDNSFVLAAEMPPTAEALNPLEGMLVAFSMAAQTFSTHLLPFLGLTLLGVTLLLVGVSKREDDEEKPRRKSGDWWFSR